MSDAPPPITYSFRWTPDVYAQLMGRKPPAALQVSGTIWRILLAALGTVAVMLAIALIPVLLGFFPRDAILALMWGAVATLIAILLVIIPYVKRAMARADLATRARQGETRVTLGPEGVRTEAELMRGEHDWGAISHVSDAPKAVLLWIGAALALPVPDEALPEGVDRAELKRRIAIWRGEGA